MRWFNICLSIVAVALFTYLATAEIQSLEVQAHAPVTAISLPESGGDSQFFGRKTTFRQAVNQAIRQSDLPATQKLQLRIVMALRPEAREAVEEFLLDKANESGMSIASADAQIDLDNLERLIKLIVEYLPQIIDIILKLIGTFSADGAVVPAPLAGVIEGFSIPSHDLALAA